MGGIRLAVVGATGAVGRTMLSILEERTSSDNTALPIEQLYVFASARSAGDVITFKNQKYIIEELDENSFDRGIDIALFSAGASTSGIFAPIAASKGCLVIDNSSRWRMDKTVPLVVPEVNPEDIKLNNGIIANPNCSTIQAVVALKPLSDRYGLKRVIYSTYQAVSGAGRAGVLDLSEGIKGEPPKKFPHQIAFNCLPQIDVFEESGYTKEEQKMIDETRKILHLPELNVTATCVRVPVITGHSESVNVEFNEEFELEELKELLANAEGITYLDDPANNLYPMPINAEGTDPVFVGRVRRDFSVASGVNLWIVADNIRKGAALNAVQIAERVMNN